MGSISRPAIHRHWSPEVKNCFSTKPVNSQRQQQQQQHLIKAQLEGDYSHMCSFCFTNQWISQDIPSLSSQSECVKMDIHWFGVNTKGSYSYKEDLIIMRLLQNYKTKNKTKNKNKNRAIRLEKVEPAFSIFFLNHNSAISILAIC